MPLPLLGPIIAALGEAAAGMGGQAVAGMAARAGAGVAASGGGFALEDTLLTNAKSITAALRGGVASMFNAPTGAANAATGAAEASSSRMGVNMADFMRNAAGKAGGGQSGMAGKMNAGNWGPGDAFDAIKYGSPSSGGGGRGGNSHDKFAAGDWGPDPDWKKTKWVNETISREADRIGNFGGALQNAQSWATKGAIGAAPVAVSMASGLAGNMAGKATHLGMQAIGADQTRGGQEIAAGAAKLIETVTNPLKLLNPANLRESFMLLGKGMAHLPFDIERVSEALLDSQRHLSRFSGLIATNAALLDRQQMMLDYRMAQRTAGTNSMASRSTMMLREDLQPFKELSQNLKNLQATLANVVASGLINAVDSVTGLKRILSGINDMLAKMANAGGINAVAKSFSTAIEGSVLDQNRPKWRKPDARRP